MTDRSAAELEQVRARQLGAVELIATADRLAGAGDPELAAALYRDWIEHTPGDPLRYAIQFNFGVLLSGIGDHEAARLALEEAIRQKPDFTPAYINLGLVLERLCRTPDALSRWYEAANRLAGVNGESLSHKTAAFRQLGRLLSASHLDGNAEQVLRLSLELAPHQRDVVQQWLSLRQRQCVWPVVQALPELTRARVLAGMSSLSLAAYTDDPLLQLAVAADYAKHDIGRPARNFLPAHRRLLERGHPARPRIGYLSSDLRQHAIGHLMAELFELHDYAAVDVIVYYCGHRVDDPLHRRIRGAVPCWVDISGMSDEQAAERIVADEIGILVDINGYTHSARTRMLAMRPAPVIVNWLGFPNTTGSPYHNYIIADDVIIPPGFEIYYSETVKRLPCYQPNDRKRIVAEQAGSRREAGLPDDATVFCCFNAAHKITEFTWVRWMRILSGVPGSVLWLMDGVPSTNERLHEHAREHAIAPERIVFARKYSNPFHLARYALADLFLDTSPYGAHTTGSDALWMGVPVLALQGRCFASRVCSSLLTAIGAPELICRSGDEYVARAIELGSDRPKLDALKAKLRAARDSSILFDTKLLVSRLEDLYREMWRDAMAGRTPRPDLANLEIYCEIGAELDRDDVEIGAAENYADLYRQALAVRDAYSAILPDRRLWKGAG